MRWSTSEKHFKLTKVARVGICNEQDSETMNVRSDAHPSHDHPTAARQCPAAPRVSRDTLNERGIVVLPSRGEYRMKAALKG